MRNHEAALVKALGEWSVIESAELKRTKVALERESAFVTSLLDATDAVVVVVDRNGTIVRSNGPCERLLGSSAEELHGRRVEETFGSLDNPAVWAGNAHSFERWVESSDGSRHCLDFTCRALDGEHGSDHVVITGIDITRRKAAEEVLVAAYEMEHKIASTLQESLLRPAPNVPGLDIAVTYRPAVAAARVGGDFYDVFTTKSGNVAVLIGDVSGHGVEAAGLTETVRSSVRTLASLDDSPSFVLTHAGAALLDQTDASRFVTAAFVTLDLDSGTARYASAGHPALWASDGTWRKPECNPGPPLGIFDVPYEESAFHVDGGDNLLLHTDGLFSARDGDRFFWGAALADALDSIGAAHPSELVGRLLAHADDFSAQPISDDIAIVALRLV